MLHNRQRLLHHHRFYLLLKDRAPRRPFIQTIFHHSTFSKYHNMNNENELKELVRQKYSEIAGQERSQNLSSCCGATACCSDDVYNVMADDYTQLEGYNPDADLGLGCGIPTAFAKIKEGNTVLDLGSGAGNDAFVARKAIGASGKV